MVATNTILRMWVKPCVGSIPWEPIGTPPFSYLLHHLHATKKFKIGEIQEFAILKRLPTIIVLFVDLI